MNAQQTAMQKILAVHAGKESVQPGEFIMAKADLAMANDITAPIAIKALERAGTGHGQVVALVGEAGVGK